MCCGLVWLGHWWSCVRGLIATSAQMCSGSHCWRPPGHSPCQGARGVVRDAVRGDEGHGGGGGARVAAVALARHAVEQVLRAHLDPAQRLALLPLVLPRLPLLALTLPRGFDEDVEAVAHHGCRGDGPTRGAHRVQRPARRTVTRCQVPDSSGGTVGQGVGAQVLVADGVEQAAAIDVAQIEALRGRGRDGRQSCCGHGRQHHRCPPAGP